MNEPPPRPPSGPPWQGSDPSGGVPRHQGDPAPPPLPYSPAAAPAEPAAGDDRLTVHLVWEGVLALVTVVVTAVVLTTTPGRHFTNVLQQAGYIGLLASALAFSLRTGAPNLAVGSIGVFTGGLGAYLAAEQGWGLTAALAFAVLVATAAGFAIGVVVAALSVPAWAASLGAVLIIEAALVGMTDGRTIPVDLAAGYPTGLWFGLFLIVSIGGGVLWQVPAVRRALNTRRRAGDPGRWGGVQPNLGAVVGLTGSSLLAALAGVALLTRLHAAQPTSAQPMTLLALSAVLLGGVSVFGRRAGVLGTALGVMIIVSVASLLAYHGVSAWVSNLLAGLVIVLGLGVSRLIESVTDSTARTGSASGRPAGGIGLPAGHQADPPISGRRE